MFDVIRIADVKSKNLKLRKSNKGITCKDEVLKFLIENNEYYHSYDNIMKNLSQYAKSTIYKAVNELCLENKINRIENGSKLYFSIKDKNNE